MTVQEIISSVRDAGLTLKLGSSGKLAIFGPKARVTKDLLMALKGKRGQVAAALGIKERPECESPHCDMLQTIARCPSRCPGTAACAGGPHPEEELLYPSGTTANRYCVGQYDVGAGWYRLKGQLAWTPIPGREAIQREYGKWLMSQGVLFVEASDAA